MNKDTCPLTEEETNALANKLSLVTPMSRVFLRIALMNVQLFDEKQQDYGSRNIGDFGTYGVVVRMNDKFQRVINLFKSKRRRPVNESIRDSFRDLSNYALIAWLVETDNWE